MIFDKEQLLNIGTGVRFSTEIIHAAMEPIRILAVLAVFMLPGCNRSTNESGNSQPVAIILPNKEERIGTTPDAATLVYVGKNICRDCHPKETEFYNGSHHDLAMQEASSATVLGNFDNVTFSYNNITSRFFQRDGGYFVHTDGANGELADFEIKYTFGVTPLQQYLIEFPGGHLQALSIAWDSRPRVNGGQRWFHLYPDENIDFKDELHWTGVNQNWNYMCAECHSTALEKNYDPGSNTYHTKWAEMDVSCEACHGPGSRHVELAR
ncbi:MAG: yrrB [Gammaproteobacteria bacterium]|nr:yrrB [Gammaproteobacteria bacterium]